MRDRAEETDWSAVSSGIGACDAVPTLEVALGGEWRQYPDSACFVVESRRDGSTAHGRDTVGAMAARLNESIEEARLLAGCGIPLPLLFVDLETTGLNGGAGTYPFLIGCGWFEDEAFVTRQFVVTRMVDERSVLARVADELSRAGALVSFNGRSFDAPMLETRYSYHRLAWAGELVPHLDMLHVARRFWRRPEGSFDSGCSLGMLEHQLLGHQRHADVHGFEVPARYFQFVRTGDARPLTAVFEHNRLDLLTLAALTARALHLVRMGPVAARDAREALALGWTYARAGLESRAQEAYERAVELCAAKEHVGRRVFQAASSRSAIHIEALRSLAIARRRARRYDAAASSWSQLLEIGECPPHVAREASEALAIHHEHRARDLEAARTFALRTLNHEASARSKQAVEHRLKRIDRKRERVQMYRLDFNAPADA